MAVRAGDIKELSYNNATLGLQGTFKVKSNEGNTYDPGGVRTNDDTAQATTTGEMIIQQNYKLGMLSVVIANDMSLKTADICAQLAAAETLTVWTFTVINNRSFKGSGMLVGDIVPNIQDSTLSIKINMESVKPL
jgi:hypothetical protein